MNTQSTFTVVNPTAAQLKAITSILAGEGETAPVTKKAKLAAPLRTVSRDEDDSFAETEIDEADIVADEEEQLEFDFMTVKKAVVALSKTNPDAADSILEGVNVNHINDLQKKPKLWATVMAKVTAKTKARRR